MKVVLSEKQLKLILSKEVDIDEQDATSEPAAGTDPSSAQPKTGTSDTGNKQGYPEVGKWESGVTRGPANQIGVTKWSDVVGSSLKRDKANQLKEQEVVTGYANVKDRYKVEGQDTILMPDGNATYVPTGTKILQTIDQEYFLELLTSTSLINWVSKEKGGQGNKETDLWIPTLDLWPKIAKLDSVASFKIPAGNVYKAIFTNPILQKVTSWDEFYKLDPKPETWKFSGYYDNNNQPYKPVSVPKQNEFLNWLTDNWEFIAEILGSIIAGILTAGSSLWIQALIQVGVGMAFAGISYAIDGNEVGLAMNTFIALLPFIPAATKLGVKGPLIGLKKLGPKLAVAKTEEEVLTILKGFSKEEQLIISRCLKQLPKADFDKVVKDKLVQGFMDMARKGQITTDWVQKIPAGQLRWWKELLVEGGGALPIIAGGYAYSSAQERKKDEQELLELIKNMETNSVFNEKETDSVSWEKEIDDRILKYKQSKSKKNEKK